MIFLSRLKLLIINSNKIYICFFLSDLLFWVTFLRSCTKNKWVLYLRRTIFHGQNRRTICPRTRNRRTNFFRGQRIGGHLFHMFRKIRFRFPRTKIWRTTENFFNVENKYILCYACTLMLNLVIFEQLSLKRVKK